jgi:hypothetical protein
MNQARQPEFSQNINQIAEVWARSSMEMGGLANRIGATYLHILEPNQWLGHKPLSTRERDILAAASEPMTDIVPPMYRALFRQSENLRTQINFLDATEVFEGHEETLYLDHCCHFNLRGYNLLIENVLGPWLQTFDPARGVRAWATQDASPIQRPATKLK